ncbi:MAG TPA: hypothetical protein VHO91_05530 [Rhodopila sp.]|nr:hypothetical protein [Rhodopila sp.]
MSLRPFTVFRRSAAIVAVCGLMAAVAAPAAQARVFVGFGFGFPGYYPYYAPYVPPPVYYPPPAYYPPPPAYYPPPVVYSPPQTYSPAPPTGQRQMCYAGEYTCPMDRPVASGASCYCLGNGGQRISGRAS